MGFEPNGLEPVYSFVSQGWQHWGLRAAKVSLWSLADQLISANHSLTITTPGSLTTSPPEAYGMESARWEGGREETLTVPVSPCLPFAPRAGEALERGTRAQGLPPQAKSFWGWGTERNLKGPSPLGWTFGC